MLSVVPIYFFLQIGYNIPVGNSQKEKQMKHQWNEEFCDCGQDSVTCQIGGERICGNVTVFIKGFGNVCHKHNSSMHPDTIVARLTDPRLKHTVKWG